MPDYDEYDESAYIGPGHYIGNFIGALIIFFTIAIIIGYVGKKFDIKFLRFLSDAALEDCRRNWLMFAALVAFFFTHSDWVSFSYVIVLGCLFWGLEAWRMGELEKGEEKHISYGALVICGIIGLLFISFARR